MALDDVEQDASTNRQYVVKSGDNITTIAKSFGYNDIDDFIALNVDKYPSLENNPGLIQPGWTFNTQREAPETGSYSVKLGDNLTDIATSFGTDVDTLVKLNQDTYRSLRTDPDTIQPGWTLSVAKPEPIATPTPDIAPTQSPQNGTPPDMSADFDAATRPQTDAPVLRQQAPDLPSAPAIQDAPAPIETPQQPDASSAPDVLTDNIQQPQPAEMDEALATITELEPEPTTSRSEQPTTLTSPNEQQETHTVVSGDTLGKIAERFNTDVETLVKLNQDAYPSLKTNPGLIHPDWELSVSAPTGLADLLPNIESAPAQPEISAAPDMPTPPITEADEPIITSALDTSPALTQPPSLGDAPRPDDKPAISGSFNTSNSRDERLAQLSASVWNNIRTGEPIVTKASASQSNTLIIIDLGHNTGGDPGAESNHNHLTEIDVIDPVGGELAAQLRAQGFDVLFTRNPGERLQGFETRNSRVGPNGLTGRAARADFASLTTQHGGYQNSILLSLHADSEPTNTAKGLIAYAGSRPNGDGRVDIGRAAIDPDSRKLTQAIAGNVEVRSKTNTADATVLSRFERTQPSQGKHVAALVELGFLSNAQDASRLEDMSQAPESIAEQITSGIMAFYSENIHPQNGPDITIASLSTRSAPPN